MSAFAGPQLLTVLHQEPPVDQHQQWLEQRRKFIGGSDSASLFPEDSKYGCDVKLFFDKSGHKPDYPRTQREEDILKRGNVWESVVANYFQEQTGLKIRKIGPAVSKENQHMGVNMDRQIIGVKLEDLKALWPESESIQAMVGDCGPGYLECKTTNEYEFKRMMAEGIMADYIFQVNHGLKVKNYKWGVFAVLEPTWGQFATFPFVFMEALGQEQDRRTAEFWKHLEAGVVPEPKVKDNRCKNCIYRRSCPRSKALMAEADKEFMAEGYVADDSLAELVSDYKEAREIADQKQATVDTIKERLQQAMGARTKVEVPSCGVRISWSQTKPPMRWDGKALEGTAQVLAKWDIPEEAKCVADIGKDGYSPCEAVAAALVDVDGAAHYMCEIHATKTVKDGGAIVAKAGVSKMVMDCKRAGEPSRPFKVLTV